MYFFDEDLETHEVRTHVMRSQNHAVSSNRVLDVMVQVGFKRVHRLDEGVAHPAVLVGTRGE